MLFGIIYEYLEISTGRSAYIGKACGLYGVRKTLEVAHRRHLRGVRPTPFDYLLRSDPEGFSLHVIDELTALTATDMQMILKPLEKDRVRDRQPRYNCVRFLS